MLLVLSTCLGRPSTWAQEASQAPFYADTAAEETVDALMAAMTRDELLAQMFLVSWSGSAPTPLILQWIRERNLGGVKIFGWNGDDVPALVEAIGTMQEAAAQTDLAIPLLVATDQEGGWVRHVRGNTLRTPGNMAIGAAGLPHDAYMSARYIALELRALGINMNLAPTVDVYLNPEAHVIGPRAFSADPLTTAILGTAYYHGHEDVRVIAAAKHFPGHGTAGEDSHGSMPVLGQSFDDLWEQDLLPYRMLIPEGLPSILIGHLAYPELSGEEVPATLSQELQVDLLRGQLGFTGVAITDDMYMGGASVWGNERGLSFGELVVLAIRTGSDLVMLSRTPDFDGGIWSTVAETYDRDPAFRERVHESVRRVLLLKLRYLHDDDRVPLIPQVDRIDESLRTPESQAFFLDQATRSTTWLWGDVPQFAETERVLLAGSDALFTRVGGRYLPRAERFVYSYSPFYEARTEDIEGFRRICGEYDTIIYNIANPNGLQVLSAARETIERNDVRVVVFSTLTPVYLGNLRWADAAMAVYGWGNESYEAGFAALLNLVPAPGTLPFSLPESPP